jgi:hypothetical protein
MAKGGYIGGGTIIGPRTPQWFSHGAEEGGPAEQTEPHKGMRSRHQRRKNKKTLVIVSPRPELTSTDEWKIGKLQRDLALLLADFARLQNLIDHDRAELLALLTKYRLPLDKYPEVGPPRR